MESQRATSERVLSQGVVGVCGRALGSLSAAVFRQYCGYDIHRDGESLGVGVRSIVIFVGGRAVCRSGRDVRDGRRSGQAVRKARNDRSDIRVDPDAWRKVRIPYLFLHQVGHTVAIQVEKGTPGCAARVAGNFEWNSGKYPHLPSGNPRSREPGRSRVEQNLPAPQRLASPRSLEMVPDQIDQSVPVDVHQSVAVVLGRSAIEEWVTAERR